MPSKVPPSWPDAKAVKYIRNPSYHSSVPAHVVAFLKGSSRLAQRAQPGSSTRSFVVVRPIRSPSHPACGQYGLFATRKIPPRTHLLDYIGEVHCEVRDSDYDISLYRSQDGVNVGIDACTMGNEARFTNDYRGICDEPNAVFIDRRTETGELRISIWSGTRGIKKGDEVLVSYGKSWWRARAGDTAHDFRDGMCESEPSQW
jgi:hypothetical protein